MTNFVTHRDAAPLPEVVQLLAGDATSTADVLALARYDGGRDPTGLAFVHRVRSPVGDAVETHYAAGAAAVNYYRDALPAAMREFAARVSGRDVDFVLTPPSRRHDADPYLAVARSVYPDAVDRTRSLVRGDVGVRAGASATTAGALAAALAVRGDAAGFASYRHLLIVDDVFATGKTAGAVLATLRAHGLPSDARVTVAVALRVAPAVPAPRTGATGSPAS